MTYEKHQQLLRAKQINNGCFEADEQHLAGLGELELSCAKQLLGMVFPERGKTMQRLEANPEVVKAMGALVARDYGLERVLIIDASAATASHEALDSAKGAVKSVKRSSVGLLLLEDNFVEQDPQARARYIALENNVESLIDGNTDIYGAVVQTAAVAEELAVELDPTSLQPSYQLAAVGGEV